MEKLQTERIEALRAKMNPAVARSLNEYNKKRIQALSLSERKLSETIDASPFKQEGRGRNAAKRYHKTEEIPSYRDHIDHPGGGATYEFQSIPDNP